MKLLHKVKTCLNLIKSIPHLESRIFELENENCNLKKELHENYLNITDYQNNVVEVTALSGVHLSPCEFTLSISKQYAKFLKALLNGELYIGDDQHG